MGNPKTLLRQRVNGSLVRLVDKRHLLRKRGFAVNTDTFIEKLFPLLITGDRPAARAFVAEAITSGWSAEEISENGFWPVLDAINTLYRSDQMTSVAHHYATRLLRSLVDQVQAGYTQQSSKNKSGANSQ